jgi:hypothetical protein
MKGIFWIRYEPSDSIKERNFLAHCLTTNFSKQAVLIRWLVWNVLHSVKLLYGWETNTETKLTKVQDETCAINGGNRANPTSSLSPSSFHDKQSKYFYIFRIFSEPNRLISTGLRRHTLTLLTSTGTASTHPDTLCPHGYSTKLNSPTGTALTPWHFGPPHRYSIQDALTFHTSMGITFTHHGT